MKIYEFNCPLIGTIHENSCCLRNIIERLPEHRYCPFQQDCKEMLEDENRTILARLYEAARLVSYYNAAECEWAREHEARTLAYKELWFVIHEAVRRELDYDLSGFML